MVDDLARLRAEIKSLQAKEEELTCKLRECGEGRIEGAIAIATIVRYDQTSTDWKAIAERVGYSAQLKAAHTKVQPRVSVRTAAKLGS
jgi:hypothetical protein